MRGPGYLLRGLGLWRTRPGLMLLGMVPALLVLLLVVGGLVVLLLQVGDLVASGSPDPESVQPVRRSNNAATAGSSRTRVMRGMLAHVAPRVGVEPTSLVLIQSQAGPAGRPTGERPPTSSGRGQP